MIRRWFAKLRFRNKLLLATTVVSAICIAVASLALVLQAIASHRSGLHQRTVSLAELTAANLQAAVAFEDQDGAVRLLGNLAADPHLMQAEVFRIDILDAGAGPMPFASFRRNGGPALGEPAAPTGAAEHLSANLLEVVRPILQETETIGYLVLRVDLTEIERLRRSFAWLAAGLIALTALLAWPLSLLTSRGLTRQVKALADAADAITRSTDYSVRAEVISEDELGKLATAFNAMLQQLHDHDSARAFVEGEYRVLNETLEANVQLRTAELNQRNESLNEVVDTLRRMQSQLVESEKMAALGGLVAGIAHEINTPLGISITAVSHVGDELRRLQQSITEQRLTKTDLDALLADIRNGIGIGLSNLSRAANLVRSFKQIAVDQSSEARRRFRLDDYLREVLLSLHPKLKNRPITVEIECDADLELDSYPGVLAQIITNLLVNALVHAFGPKDSGRICIRARRVDANVQLEFSDNGRGMSETARQRVFEPFFTTNRSEGGTGLGLHITYNQVIRTLGGSIRCVSAPGSGTTVSLHFPQQAPVSATQTETS